MRECWDSELTICRSYRIALEAEVSGLKLLKEIIGTINLAVDHLVGLEVVNKANGVSILIRDGVLVNLIGSTSALLLDDIVGKILWSWQSCLDSDSTAQGLDVLHGNRGLLNTVDCSACLILALPVGPVKTTTAAAADSADDGFLVLLLIPIRAKSL